MLGISPGSPYMVVEVGIRQPGQMGPIARMLQPNVVVVTSIKGDHQEYFGTLEVTRSEKAEMLRVLPASGTAVLNGDDPNVLWMGGQTRAKIVTFGLGPANDIRAENISLHWPHGTQFRLYAGGEIRDVSIRLVGKPMVYAVLAAVAVALAEGRTLDQVIPALATLPPTPGRLQPVQLEDGTILLRDDGKGTVESLESALEFLSEVPVTRKGIVVGEQSPLPGDFEAIYEGLGQRIASVASYAIFCGDSPAVHAYLRGAQRGGLPSERTVHVRGSILDAVRPVRERIEPGDVVLLKARSFLHFERIELALEGRVVRCELRLCTWGLLCAYCPMLERGWGGG
jgi:UDP-N-acetylmuramyl pentapeptide synthase